MIHFILSAEYATVRYVTVYSLHKLTLISSAENRKILTPFTNDVASRLSVSSIEAFREPGHFRASPVSSEAIFEIPNCPIWVL